MSKFLMFPSALAFSSCLLRSAAPSSVKPVSYFLPSICVTEIELSFVFRSTVLTTPGC